MMTILDRLAEEVDSSSMDSALSTQIGLFGDISDHVERLVDTPPGVGEFTKHLAALQVTTLPDGAAITDSLSAMQATLSTIEGRAAGGVLGEVARFSNLITADLAPVLRGAVAVARSIEQLASADFRCPPEGAATVAGPSEPPPDGAPGSPDADRLRAAQDAAERVDAVLAVLPNPLTATTLIEFVAGLTTSVRARFLGGAAIPMLDDLVRPLETLTSWSASTAPEMETHISTPLTALRDRLGAAGPELIDAVAAGAAALETPLRAGDLAAFADGYVDAAEAVHAALSASDTATAILRTAELDTAIASFETVRATMASDFTAAVPAVVDAVTRTPERVLNTLVHLATQLEAADPVAALAVLDTPTSPPPEVIAELQETLAPVIDLLEDLIAVLDLSEVEDDVAAVATEAQEIADGVNAALAGVVLDLRAALGEVEAAAAALDLDELAADVRGGIAAAGEALRTAVGDGFAPLRDSLAGAITALSDVIGDLEFTAIEAALGDIVAEIAGVLNDPAVTGAIGEIRGALDDVTVVVRDLSFTVVTDEVVALIEAMTSGLRSAIATDLNDALKAALITAMSVLPPDLRPVTEPLVDDFGELIDDGPVALLEAIRSKPQEVLDQIRSLNPAALVGDALAGPFEETTERLDAFRPSAVFARLEAELEAQKRRLATGTKPSVALRPLTLAFDDVLAAIDRLSPGPLLAPIEEAIEQAVREAVEASPVDEIFAEVDGVYATVEGVIDSAVAIGDTMARLAATLATFSDHEAQIDAWRDDILAKLDAVQNEPAITAALADVREAIDATRHADLLERFDAATGPLRAALEPLAPGERLAQITRMHQQLRPLVQTLPDGAAKDTLSAVLERFDPLDPEATGGFRAAAELERGIRAARAALVQLGPELDTTLHGPAGALTAIAADADDSTTLRNIVADEIEATLRPVRHVAGAIALAAVPIDAFARSFGELATRLTGAIGSIATGPTSLRAIADNVQAVVDTLRNLDLAVLRESIDDVFRAARAQVEVLGPQPLIIELDREYQLAIDQLALEQILPESEIAELDGTYEAALGQLRALDPTVLVTDVVGPVFDEQVMPILEVLDLTPVFDALIDALRALDGELERELERVVATYQGLLDARPGAVSASVGA